MKQVISVFWFRRDLRLHDNAGLYHALRANMPVLPIFIFDTDILDDLKDRSDRRLAFIRDSLLGLQERLEQLGSSLHVLHGRPIECFKGLLEVYNIKAVFTNRDYEPYATKRDEEIAAYLKTNEIPFRAYKDQVIFDTHEVLKDNGEPYTVYTPYSKKWKARLSEFYQRSYPTEKYYSKLYKHAPKPIPSFEALGFKKADYHVVPARLNPAKVNGYEKYRDYPAMDHTTHLSVHLRFGTISIRELVSEAREQNEKLLNEIIWREFYSMILWHFPKVVAHAFKEEYDHIRWRNNEKEFELWCSGKTGFPIVDAGMRELNETGYMHNRVRLIVASFLTKDLLIDWRWGEAYFAEKLLDYDLASNNGNWQWAAGTGCDAAPYFRVFNPQLQTEKFDPEHKYIRRWLPEYDSPDYSPPIVDHAAAKERCLEAYKAALQKA